MPWNCPWGQEAWILGLPSQTWCAAMGSTSIKGTQCLELSWPPPDSGLSAMRYPLWCDVSCGISFCKALFLTPEGDKKWKCISRGSLEKQNWQYEYICKYIHVYEIY